MTSKTSRRAVLAGAATLPALSLSSLAAPADPIFAAIEKHRATYLAWCPCGSRESNMRLDDPRKNEIEAASSATLDANYEAGRDLVRIVPTSIAGVLALLQYIEQFNAGELKIHGVPHFDSWASSPFAWPRYDEKIDGSDSDMFAFHILANVRAGLAGLAA